jgi:hypothetical protein
MHKTSAFRAFLIITLSLIGIILAYYLLRGNVGAQTSCCYTDLMPSGVAKWPTNVTVTVTISRDFTETERQWIEAAFRDWNAVKTLIVQTSHSQDLNLVTLLQRLFPTHIGYIMCRIKAIWAIQPQQVVVPEYMQKQA